MSTAVVSGDIPFTRLLRRRCADAHLQHDERLLDREHAEPGHHANVLAAADEHPLPRLHLQSADGPSVHFDA